MKRIEQKKSDSSQHTFNRGLVLHRVHSRSHKAYLNAYLLPVKALRRFLLGFEVFATTAIKVTASGWSIDAFREAHLVFTATSGACECHALYQRLDCTDPHNCPFHTNYFACMMNCCLWFLAEAWPSIRMHYMKPTNGAGLKLSDVSHGRRMPLKSHNNLKRLYALR